MIGRAIPIRVENRFHLGHGERTYEEMVAHFKDYNDIIGDHPQNMGATTLAANAFMLTGEEKYKQWLLEYVDAWIERTEANDGIIPSNIGLDGRLVVLRRASGTVVYMVGDSQLRCHRPENLPIAAG